MDALLFLVVFGGGWWLYIRVRGLQFTVAALESKLVRLQQRLDSQGRTGD